MEASTSQREGLAAAVRGAALEAGLHRVGITTSDPFPEVRTEMERRIESGESAGLRFTYSDPAASTDVRRSFPWARSLVVGAWAYAPHSGSPGPARPGTARVARFATADHYAPLRSALDRIAGLLTGAGHRAEVLVDDNRLVDRAAAVRAGVAWWGKSTLVLSPGAGPWLLVGSVVTDAVLDADEPMVRGCGSCTACIPACPTGAITAPGVLDSRRCLAHVLQAPGPIPLELRPLVGDRLYGCDDCLEACPPGTAAIEGRSARSGRYRVDEVLGMADRTLLARFAHFYIPRNRARFLRRNALVVLGNSGDPGLTGIAAGFVGNPDPLLRRHAAWALGRLGGSLARSALRHAAGRESDRDVAGEVSAALGAVVEPAGTLP
jgi:epoxyqueuosine reductase